MPAAGSSRSSPSVVLVAPLVTPAVAKRAKITPASDAEIFDVPGVRFMSLCRPPRLGSDQICLWLSGLIRHQSACD